MKSHQETAEWFIRAPQKPVFVIPTYQREFEWATDTRGKGNGQIHEFIEDIFTYCWDGDARYFMGTMILKPFFCDTRRQQCYEMVDGQQRTTCLFLLFLAIRDLAKQAGAEDDLITPWLYDHSGQACRLQLSEGQRGDREVLDALLAGTSDELPKERRDEKHGNRAYLAYRALRSELTSRFGQDVEALRRFGDAVADKLIILSVHLDPEDQPELVFASLNVRGKKVDETELVRNLILFPGRENEHQAAKGEELWSQIEDNLDEVQIEDFIEVLGRLNGINTVRRSPLDEIKYDIEWHREQGRPEEWLKQVGAALDIYYEIVHPHVENYQLNNLLRLEVRHIEPLIVNIIMREGKDSPLLGSLESLIVRLLVIYDRPSLLIQRIVGECCDLFKFDQDPARWRDELIRYFEYYWVDDDRFAEAFVGKRMYGPGVKRRRLLYMLEQLERAHSPNMPFVKLEDQGKNRVSVEHIMPQKLNKDWKDMLCAGYQRMTPADLKSLHDGWLHTIGNLTVLLVRSNSGLGNRPFKQKRDFYVNPNACNLEELGIKATPPIATLAMNHDFKGKIRWNFNMIHERGKRLAKLACSVWRKHHETAK